MDSATAAPPAPADGRSPDEADLERQAKEADARAGADGGEPLPGEGEGEQGGEEAPPAIPPLEMRGDGGQLSLKVGGDKPTKAQLKLRGGAVDIPGGEYAKGATIDVVVKVRIAEVHFADHRDNQTGEVTATIRRHIGKIENIERVD